MLNVRWRHETPVNIISFTIALYLLFLLVHSYTPLFKVQVQALMPLSKTYSATEINPLQTEGNRCNTSRLTLSMPIFYNDYFVSFDLPHMLLSMATEAAAAPSPPPAALVCVCKCIATLQFGIYSQDTREGTGDKSVPAGE